ncbi:hypothetical protein [Dactylosporangium sp. NPDC000521]|uniref:hypothetical protein n=1 Tax=Dactylosporangium sp. NPDC000521 TaxID=3363975 RepID=UPI00367FEB59
MSRSAYVYVGERADGNFRIGMRGNIWGWKTFDGGGPLVAQAEQWLRDPDRDEPTWIIFVRGIKPPSPAPKGWPRTRDEDFDAWTGATIRSVTQRLLRAPLYEDHVKPVWPDDLYPYRVTLEPDEPDDTFGPVPAADFSEDAIRAIRHSALQKGWPVLGPPLVDPPPIAPDQRLATGAVIRTIALERNMTRAFVRRPGESRQATRREADLVMRYEAYLAGLGRRAVRNLITLPGGLDTFFTDVFEVDTEELVEAKSTAGREHIRHAIGQLYDYARFVRPRSRAVLLPTRPKQDLVDLLTGLDIDIIYEPTHGNFVREPARRAP